MAKFKRVVVTGGMGCIGSNYVRRVLQLHPTWDVVVLDKLTYAGNVENLGDVMDRITFVCGDIVDATAAEEALKDADAVVHLAAETHVDRSLLGSREFVRSNVEGTLVLLEMSRRCGVRRFLYASTDEVYGDTSKSGRGTSENAPIRPRSPYAATKAAAEHMVLSYGASFGLDVTITRAANTYGPFQYPEKIVSLFITNALEGRRLPLYGNGSAVRDYLYVDDHVSGLDVVLHRGHSMRAYNLGARLQLSGVEVANDILQSLGQSLDLKEFVPDRPGHDYRYSVDPTDAESLGWRRDWTWQSGLARTIAWYSSNKPWWRTIKTRQDFKQYEEAWYMRRKQAATQSEWTASSTGPTGGSGREL